MLMVGAVHTFLSVSINVLFMSVIRPLPQPTIGEALCTWEHKATQRRGGGGGGEEWVLTNETTYVFDHVHKYI